MTLFRVVDTETTGMEHGKDCVVELAFVDLNVMSDDYTILGHYDCLINPGIPILASAKAIHHITESDVVHAPSLEEALAGLAPMENMILVAHNVAFDQGFLPAWQHYPWLCTYRMAKHVLDQDGTEGYGNQYLRYHLGVEPVKLDTGAHESDRKWAPHRALYDATTTAGLLLHLLPRARVRYPRAQTVRHLIDCVDAPVLQRRLGFGKYRGRLWSEVDRGYLDWMKRNATEISDDDRYTLEQELLRRGTR